MLLNASNSLLLVIDIQSRLAPSIDKGSSVINNSCWLIEVAKELNIPVRATEQYPQGIGESVPPIKDRLKTEEILQKMHFSALKEDKIKEHLANLNRKQIVMVGTEAHVCVFQTAADLLANGYQVYLVEEAVGSRKTKDKELALERLKQMGAQIICREMAAFEWLEKSGTDTFRKVVKDWIK
ncbi:hydrolase [Marinospirillum insulare]|uniref:Hydrolase n=1 Tax=Marinospirillum insulare TaxID=217169 RepID=A0ABQ6A4Z3_9GAMM|nr:hydrolase [Marinospirillum insulare]GLR65189.1 hydrolase [Marinospirillum insulare]